MKMQNLFSLELISEELLESDCEPLQPAVVVVVEEELVQHQHQSPAWVEQQQERGKKRRSSSTCSKTKWKLKRIMKTLELILSWILNRFLNLSLHVIIININLHSITVVIVVTHCCRHHPH